MIGFEGDVWPQKEFPAGMVRKPPTKQTGEELAKFNPKVGDEIEVRLQPSEHSPAAWSAATVRNIKNNFYFVARSDAHSSEIIVEKDQLRPLSTTGALILSSASMKQEAFKLPANLKSWVNGPDAVGCFTHIEDQAGLIHVGVHKGNLRLLGDKNAIHRAKMLLDVHVKHQTQILNFQDVREKRLKALEQKRNRIEGAGFKHSIEFKIDPSFVARIIGQQGKAVKAVEEKYGVQVTIRDTDRNSEEEQVVRIFGNTTEMIDKARAEVEYIEEVVPVEASETNRWVLGRCISGVKDHAGLVYAKLDRAANTLSLCGTRHAVDDAIAMFETHMMYFPVFDEMQSAMEKIITQLEEHGDRDARYEWEWGWWNEEEGRLGGGTRSYTETNGSEKKTKGKGKGKEKDKEKEKEPEKEKDKGKGKGKDKDVEKGAEKGAKANGKSSSKDEKPAKGNGKVSRKNDHLDADDEGEDDDDDWSAPAARKPDGKGATKAVWRAKEPKEPEPDSEAKGSGKSGKKEKSGAEAKASDTASEVVERPDRPAPGTRKRGKMGVRGSGDDWA